MVWNWGLSHGSWHFFQIVIEPHAGQHLLTCTHSASRWTRPEQIRRLRIGKTSTRRACKRSNNLPLCSKIVIPKSWSHFLGFFCTRKTIFTRLFLILALFPDWAPWIGMISQTSGYQRFCLRWCVLFSRLLVDASTRLLFPLGSEIVIRNTDDFIERELQLRLFRTEQKELVLASGRKVIVCFWYTQVTPDFSTHSWVHWHRYECVVL